MLLSSFSDLWFVGDSYVHWLEDRTKFRGIAINLGNQSIHKVKWISKRGMHWSELNQVLQYQFLYHEPPKIIIVHLGSNDLTTTTGCELEHKMRDDLRSWMSAFPQTIFMFSELLPRLTWRAVNYPYKKIDKKRKHLNNCVRRFMSSMGGHFIKHSDITADTPGMYFEDGVHLSDVGYDFMLLNINDILDSL